MSTKALRALESELGDRAPAGVAALGDPELRAFTGLLRGAKRRQSETLHAAVEDALEIVPRMVRGPVRKILFGP
ncbi:MAG: hypothetical protein QOJ35_3641 [Solirubrobacteraceae bacterium]|jgi:hypothetical protein|nr:hypothetical protein [Solirubrobacteraceae bacterium]